MGDVVDEVQEVDSPQSYRMSMLLSREGLICGPSSGMALQALLNVLQKAKDEGRLAEFAAADGQVRAVFPCCDLPYQYMDNYALKLGPSAFEPIGDVVSVFIFGYGLPLGLTLGNAASPRHRHPPV